MELILKKSKITSGILTQTVLASYSELKTFDVIGWCVHKNHKWIILYNHNTHELRKYLMIKEISTDVYYMQHRTIIRFEGNVNCLTYNAKDDEESQDIYNEFNKVRTEALSRGQFFI